MSAVLNDAFARLREEWQANRRLQLGGGLIVLILLLSLHQALDRWRAEQHGAAAAAAMALQELQGALTDRHWPERAEQAAAARDALEQRLWRAASEGGAQAALRDFLQAEAARQGVTIERIDVRALPASRDQAYPVVRAELQGGYMPLAWQRFLAAVAGHQPALVVESERLDRSIAQRPRYHLAIAAWYQLEKSEGQP